ncbi:hypothetical protein SteCoe_33502 [Stentor coeruleus]|uniref:Checkpoint protein n=1 Tax=Stentor coeruleus TaxID=5963 RepID=A0A1R2AWK7_9CILI|nr:hypothetical protein SteCoe_33502 [Stentor coeruleus]
MRLQLECQGSMLSELLKAIRSCCSQEFVFITLQDDIMVIQDDCINPNSWVEIDVKTQQFFKSYTIKSKNLKNRIVLKVIHCSLVEALQGIISLPGSKAIIKLASQDGNIYLEFKCEVPEQNEIFSFEYQVAVNIDNSIDNIIPEIPNSLECELNCVQHMQQMIFPTAEDSNLLQLCLTVEECHNCRAKDRRDLDYVFSCSHNRKNFKLPELGKLTIKSRETTPVQLISAYYNLILQQGQCSLYNIKTLVKAKELSTILQKTYSLNWNKVMLGIQHESEIIATASWKECLSVRFIISAQLDNI